MLAWGLVLLLLLARRKNRTGQAWLIFVPLVVVALLWRLPLRLISAPADVQQVMGILAISLSAGWAAVWLAGDWIGRRNWVIRQVAAGGLLLLSGAISYVNQYGIAGGDQLVPLGIIVPLCALSLLAATGLSARCCRREYRPGVFVAWHALWSGLVSAGLMVLLALGLTVGMVLDGGDIGFIAVIVVQLVIGTVLFGAVTFLVNLPFAILAFKSPFWRERFRNTYRLAEQAVESFGWRPSPFVEPVATEPTAAEVGVDDVAGTWQFYLDEHARTVTVEFNPDGTFSQSVMTNLGDVTPCPGGTWWLDGPMIHLSGYAAVGHGAGEDRTWWMIDTPAGLAVFGGDALDPAAFFSMNRVSVATR